MCTGGDALPGSAAEALALMRAGADYLLDPGLAGMDGGAMGETLRELAVIGSKQSAAWNACLARFDAGGGHDADGYQTTAAWLAGNTGTDLGAARGQVRRMRQITARPVLEAALGEGAITESLAAAIIAWTKPLPSELREEADEILLAAAAAGARPEDLRVLAVKAVETWKSTRPDPDDPDDGFGGRRVALAETFGGAGELTGDLTAECAAAVRAVCEALGKKQGSEDTRSGAQRWHDALQEGCELLLRARLVPDRAGSDTRVDAVISLAELRGMDGAAALEDAWLAGTGGPVWLAGKGAETIACDALISPVVTGSCDWDVIGQMTELVLDAYAHGGAPRRAGETLPAEAWRALQEGLARLAIGFVSGPGGLASALRRSLLEYPFNGRSVPIDVGVSASIPEAVRRAVRLRDRHCRWPGGCTRPAAVCDCHHVTHKKDGGPTSVGSCLLLCQYHHDICVHRWGWKLQLLPDGEVTATGPRGQTLHSHPPPATGPPTATGPPAAVAPPTSTA